MHRQTLEFAVTRNGGSITRIGRSSMFRPKPDHKGDAGKGHDGDKPHKPKQTKE